MREVLVQAVSAPQRESYVVTRVVDLACAILGLLVFLPVFALIAAAIKLCDSGPVFYTQVRIGRNFVPFRLIKFRSMTVGAEHAGSLTGKGDPRVTRVGRILRAYKLDELPQLLNVLTGNMQLVGPRPEVSRYVEMFVSEYSILLQRPPGITDPASLAYRHEEEMLSEIDAEDRYTAELLPKKLSLSIEYQARRDCFSDIRILLQTARAVFS